MKKTLTELNNWASKLTVTQIEQLPEEEIIEYIMERPGHPGQYGFMLGIQSFKSVKDFSNIFSALMARLGKIENLEEKIQK
jgi:ABC-type antimicrobial peptide transport system ATPase subunit